MLTFRKLRLYYLLVAIPLVLTLIFGSSRNPLRADLRNLVFDYYQRLQPRDYDPDSPVRIIDIDDESLRKTGQWPWPRNQMAAIVDLLVKAHVAAIGFDFLFSEPDHGDIETLLRDQPQSRAVGLIDQEMSNRRSLDAIFAHSIGNNPVVLAAVLTNGSTKVDMPAKSGFVFAGDNPERVVTAFPSGIPPLPILSEQAAGIGAINWLPDRDRTVRRVPLIMSMKGTLVPSLGLELLRVAQGASTYVIKSSNANGEGAFGSETGVNAVKVGTVVVPTQSAGDIRIHFTRSEPRRYLPAWQLFADDSARAGLEGKIVLVGSSAATLNDIIATPLSPSMPGVEVIAQMIEQMIAGDSLVRPDWAEGSEFLIALVLGLMFILCLPRISALWGSVAGGMAALAIVGSSWWAYTAHGLLIDPLYPSLWPGAVFLTGVVALYGIKRRQEFEIRNAFGRFVSPTIVARLAEHPERLKLGGDQRELTLMFCDLRSFTTLSEGLSAQALTHLLNDYLTPMTDIILDHSGTIDKYMGDAIMAFWNAPLDDPDHIRNGARAALAMRRCLSDLNAAWAADPGRYGKPMPQVRFGIGLNTGEACVGNLGSLRRFDYSVIGDEVNVSSRLESATKQFGVDIVANETTRQGAPELAWLRIDAVLLKGKTKPIGVHALVGDETLARSDAFRTLTFLHDGMLTAYAGRDFAQACGLARQAAALAPSDIAGLYAYNLRRFEKLASDAPDPSWMPLTILDDK